MGWDIGVFELCSLSVTKFLGCAPLPRLELDSFIFKKIFLPKKRPTFYFIFNFFLEKFSVETFAESTIQVKKGRVRHIMFGKRKPSKSDKSDKIERDVRALNRSVKKLKTIHDKQETEIARLQAKLDATQRKNAEIRKDIAGIIQRHKEDERKKVLYEIEKDPSPNREIQSMLVCATRNGDSNPMPMPTLIPSTAGFEDAIREAARVCMMGGTGRL